MDEIGNSHALTSNFRPDESTYSVDPGCMELIQQILGIGTMDDVSSVSSVPSKVADSGEVESLREASDTAVYTLMQPLEPEIHVLESGQTPPVVAPPAQGKSKGKATAKRKKEGKDSSKGKKRVKLPLIDTVLAYSETEVDTSSEVVEKEADSVNACKEYLYDSEDDDVYGNDIGDGLWVAGTQPVSYVVDIKKKCFNYGQALCTTIHNIRDAYAGRHPFYRNHGESLAYTLELERVIGPVLDTFVRHLNLIKELQSVLDSFVLPVPRVVSESAHSLESYPSKRIQNAMERLRVHPDMPLKVEDVKKDVKSRDSFLHSKTRKLFENKFEKKHPSAARTRLFDVLYDLKLAKLMVNIPCTTDVELRALLAKLGQLEDSDVLKKFHTFLFRRAVSREKLHERFAKNKNSAQLADAIGDERREIVREFNEQVSCYTVTELVESLPKAKVQTST